MFVLAFSNMYGLQVVIIKYWLPLSCPSPVTIVCWVFKAGIDGIKAFAQDTCDSNDQPKDMYLIGLPPPSARWLVTSD